MKTLFLLMGALFMATLSFSQTTVPGTVTVTVNGNRTSKIAVDNRYYGITTTSINGQEKVVIGSLTNGMHSLAIVRKNPNNKVVTSKSTFNLRPGYDLMLTINANGGISTSERRIGNQAVSGTLPVSAAVYNKLYAATKKKASSASRAAFLQNEWTNTSKWYTSKQASALIQLVNSESLRFDLIKLSYARITDKENFSLVSALLKSTVHTTALNEYVSAYADDNDQQGSVSNPLTNEKFGIIYNEVNAETTASDKRYYLENFFRKEYNFFTSSQVRQLVQLIASEDDRLFLAKTAYRGITDKENYSQVFQLLSNTNDRAELTAYISTYDSTHLNTAMSAADFNKYYQAAYSQKSTSARYASINTVFSTNGNYFTAAQAKQMIRLVNVESSRLLLAKTVYKVLVDRPAYTQFNEFLSAAGRNDLHSYVTSYDHSYSTGGRTPMTDEAYNQIYKSIRDTWNTTSRVNLTAGAFTNSSNYFTTYQVRQLLLLINSENERLVLAKNAYDNVTDQENFTQLYELFNNGTNKDALSRFVNDTQNGTGTVAYPAVSDANFNKLYETAYYERSAAGKYTSVYSAFTATGNYFTVAQAKQMIQLVNTEADRLQLAKTVYRVLVDRSDYAKFNDFLSASGRNDFYTYVSNYDQSSGSGERTPMTDAAYNQVYKSINDSWSASSRINLATTTFNNSSNYFTTYQVRQLLLLINSENDRLALAKNSYDNVTDPYNFNQLGDLFTSTASKNELANYAATMHAGGTVAVKVPMTETAFNSIYRDVQFTFGLGAKMTTLTGVFNTETNYFTVQQAKQLIQMVSAENNRLELAKSAYSNITDPMNFSQLYDILSLQASKEELMAFVGSSAYNQ
jgi:succinate dehydrogenase flavin-adding protein (antitoxin of CptAB toxin-antitoxin module)